jgi:hypothetical protein
MRKIAVALGLASLLALPGTFAARGQHVHAEMDSNHPRLASAVHELEIAIKYLEAAPHDFGGRREDAIRDARAAIAQLRAAMTFQYHGPDHQH